MDLINDAKHNLYSIGEQEWEKAYLLYNTTAYFIIIQ
jgi:hypothetical protein